jgi:FtsZ-binding cell division protein ZapB
MIHFLCIEKTNILLLEMPFRQWDESVLREIEQLQNEQHLCVVIAHLDRYFQYQKNPYYLNKLLQMPVRIQLNADAFGRFRRREVLKLVKNGRVDALGSDCHNMRNRAPNLETAVNIIQKKLGAQYLEQIDRKCRQLLPQNTVQEPVVTQDWQSEYIQQPEATLQPEIALQLESAPQQSQESLQQLYLSTRQLQESIQQLQENTRKLQKTTRQLREGTQQMEEDSAQYRKGTKSCAGA